MRTIWKGGIEEEGPKIPDPERTGGFHRFAKESERTNDSRSEGEQKDKRVRQGDAYRYN